MNDSTAAIDGAMTGDVLAERAAQVREEVSKAFIGQADVLGTVS